MDFGTDDTFQYALLETLARRMKPTLYLEMGVRDGSCIMRVKPHAGHCVGVDLQWPAKCTGYEFHLCSTRDFIKDRLPKFRDIELCFIDADHSAKSVLEDFEGVLPYMADNGLILLHDTFPEDESRTAPNESGDCWKTASHIRQHSSQYNVEIVTIPVPPGFSIIRKLGGTLPWMR